MKKLIKTGNGFFNTVSTIYARYDIFNTIYEWVQLYIAPELLMPIGIITLIGLVCLAVVYYVITSIEK